jgi:hypothetical protein
MRRLPDWEARLFELVAEAKHRDFEWGVHDCCTFAAAAVEAVTGTRPVLPGAWTTARGALRLAARQDGLPAAVSTALGRELGPALLAQRGDIVLLRQPSFDGHALAVCLGAYAVAPGPHGLVSIRLDSPECLGAWRVTP